MTILLRLLYSVIKPQSESNHFFDMNILYRMLVVIIDCVRWIVEYSDGVRNMLRLNTGKCEWCGRLIDFYWPLACSFLQSVTHTDRAGTPANRIDDAWTRNYIYGRVGSFANKQTCPTAFILMFNQTWTPFSWVERQQQQKLKERESERLTERIMFGHWYKWVAMNFIKCIFSFTYRFGFIVHVCLSSMMSRRFLNSS